MFEYNQPKKFKVDCSTVGFMVIHSPFFTLTIIHLAYPPKFYVNINSVSLDTTRYPGETENNGYAKCWGR